MSQSISPSFLSLYQNTIQIRGASCFALVRKKNATAPSSRRVPVEHLCSSWKRRRRRSTAPTTLPKAFTTAAAARCSQNRSSRCFPTKTTATTTATATTRQRRRGGTVVCTALSKKEGPHEVSRRRRRRQLVGFLVDVYRRWMAAIVECVCVLSRRLLHVWWRRWECRGANCGSEKGSSETGGGFQSLARKGWEWALYELVVALFGV